MNKSPLQYFDGKEWRYSHTYGSRSQSKGIFVAGGPSLGKINKDALVGPGKTVYGINNTYPAIRPDVWIGMDDPRCYNRHVLTESFMKVMRGGYQWKTLNNVKLKEYPNLFFCELEPQENKTSLFHYITPDSDRLCWAKNTFHVTLQLMLHMGHKEIYLAGHDFSNKEGDYFNGETLPDEYQQWNQNLYNSLDKFMRWFVPTAEFAGITVKSLSPDSPINEYMEFQSIENLNAEIATELPELGPLYHCRDVDESTTKVCSDEYKELLRHEHRTSNWGVMAQQMVPQITAVADKYNVSTILDYGAGSGGFKRNCPSRFKVVEYDPGIPEKDKIPFPEDFVICIDVMEHIEPNLLPGVLRDLSRVVKKAGYFSISTIPARRILKDGRNAHLIVKPAEWWVQKLSEHFNIVNSEVSKIGVEIEVTKWVDS